MSKLFIILTSFFLVLLLFVQGISFSQKQENIIDSLIQILKTAKEDTSKVNTLNTLSKSLWQRGDYGKSRVYADDALSLSEKTNFRKGFANSYNNIGVIYREQGNYAEALRNIFKALKTSEAIGYKMGLAESYNIIGGIYNKQENYPEAIKNHLAALKIAKEINNRQMIANSYGNLGNTYSGANNYSESLKYYLSGLKIQEEIGDRRGIAFSTINIGVLYLSMKRYSEAEQYLKKGLQLSKEIGNRVGIAFCYNNLGAVSIELKKLDEAKEYFLKGLKASDEIKSKDLKRKNYLGLSNIDSINGNFSGAYQYFRLYSRIKDSILNEASDKQIAQMKIMYETEKKELQISALEKEKTIQKLDIEKLREKKKVQVIIFSGIVILIFILVLVIYYRFKLKQKNILEREMALQRELRYQDVIDAQEKERKRIAEDLHDSLGQMLSTIKLHMESVEYNREFNSDENRKVLRNTIGYMDEACKEVRNISHHLMPEALIRLGLIPAISDMTDVINRTKKIKINLTSKGFDKRLESSIEINVYRIIQELIGNVIKHAQASEMDICLNKQNEHVFLTITDNGKGFYTGQTSKVSETFEVYEGIGLKNIRSRVEILNGKIDISSEIESGTKISINFVV